MKKPHIIIIWTKFIEIGHSGIITPEYGVCKGAAGAGTGATGDGVKLENSNDIIKTLRKIYAWKEILFSPKARGVYF